MMRHRLPQRFHGQAGFTLIEVLVAILLVSIGLFGFAKMQALSLSSTHVAASRSLVAMQTSSLAAAMHGNREFWATQATAIAFQVNGASVIDSSGVLNAKVNTCEANSKPSTPLCTPQQLAAWEVQQWAANMNKLLLGLGAQVSCTARAVDVPVSCVITVNWAERYVAANNATVVNSAATATGGAQDRKFTLYVKP